MGTSIKAMLCLLVAGIASASAAQAQSWEGYLQGGLAMTDRISTTHDIFNSPYFGTFIGGYGAANVGAFRFAVDGQAEFVDTRGTSNVLLTGPLHSGVVGAHIGAQFGQAYVGAFAGGGWFDAAGSSKPKQGSIYGLEAEWYLPNGGSLYAQYGQARAIAVAGDNEFDGYDIKIGAMLPAGDRLTIDISAEDAFSANCFVECGVDEGRNVIFGLGATYRLTDRIDLVGNYAYSHITVNNKLDHATSSNVYVGVRIPLGARPTSALRTPVAAIQGAGWMQQLN